LKFGWSRNGFVSGDTIGEQVEFPIPSELEQLEFDVWRLETGGGEQVFSSVSMVQSWLAWFVEGFGLALVWGGFSWCLAFYRNIASTSSEI